MICLQKTRKLSTIYGAEKSYDFVFEHGVDIYRLSSNQGNGFLFIFHFLKKLIPRFIPVSKFLRVVENHSQSDKSHPLPLFLFCSPSLILPGISTFLFVCS